MDKLKRFIDCYIPTETCNLRCHYCYITQQRRFNHKLFNLSKSKNIMRKALSVKRLGGICLINLCAGGETLLSNDILGVVKVLLEEGHYIMIVTNGTLSKRFDEVVSFSPHILKRLFFKFSFHYLELIRIGKLDAFFDNIKKVEAYGCSYTVEITPCDEIIPHISDIKNICFQKLGTLCHITIARDDRANGIDILSDYSFEEYKKIWGVFDSELFDFKSSIFYKKRKEFCYAGDWSFYLNLNSGSIRQCYCGKRIGNIYKNLAKPLKLEAIGHGCTLPHCYNGHVFLTLGVIPELNTTTYHQVRNRIDNTEHHWVKTKMREIMSQKLKDNNSEYDLKKKMYISCKNILNTLINRDKIYKFYKTISQKGEA